MNINKRYSGSLNSSKDSPLIAILLCTKNGALYLSEQLESLEKQTHKNWVIIASDDGSTDQTIEILHQYQAKWPPGKLRIRSGPQKGFCQNFLSLACDPAIKADYYAFCDQDDVWLSEKLEAGVLSLIFNCDKVNSIPMLYGGKTIYVDENLNYLSHSTSFNYPKVFRNALVQTMAGGNTLIFNQISKLLLERTRGANPASHDWWLYLIVSGAGGLCIYDPNPQILYRQHNKSLIGENRSILAKLKRFYFLLGGRFKIMVDMNVKSLIQHKKILNKDAYDTLSNFLIMRESSLLLRIRLLSVCGLFRQTKNGTIALFIAVVINQI